MSRRPRNPRRIAHELLGRLKEAAGRADYTWAAPPSLRWFADEPGREAHYHRQARTRADIPPDEYPENDPEQWGHLVTWAQVIRDNATALENFARSQQAAAEQRRQAP